MPAPLTRRTLLRMAASLPVVAAAGMAGCAGERPMVLPEGEMVEWVRVDLGTPKPIHYDVIWTGEVVCSPGAIIRVRPA